jgi:glycine oxidase
MYQELSTDLFRRTGIDNGYRICGGIEFLQPDDPHSVASWQAEQVPFDLLSPKALRASEPAVSPQPLPAYYFPGMAQVRNPRHVRALIAACNRQGVAFQTGSQIAAIEHREGRVECIRLANGESRSAGQYLVAAGAWSEQLLGPLGLRCGIHPVRGQIVLLKSEKPLLRRIILVGKNYLVPRDDGHLLIGSTEEPEAGFVKQTTPAAIADLLIFAGDLAPDLAAAKMVKSWAGLRPGSRDGRPSLGRVGDFRNLFVAAGHFRAGIQLSPATALVMSELLLGKTPSIALDDFRPDRRTIEPLQSAFRS